MAVPVFTVEAFSYLYNMKIYPRTYNRSGTTYEEKYAGYLAGYPKSQIPSALLTTSYGTSITPVGKTLEVVRGSSFGHVWDTKIFDYQNANGETVSAYLFIHRDRISTYYAYTLSLYIVDADEIVISYIDYRRHTRDNWAETWEELNNLIYISFVNSGSNLSNYVPIMIYGYDSSTGPVFGQPLPDNNTTRAIPITEDIPEPEEEYTPYSQGGYSEGSGGFPSSSGGGLGTYSYTHEPIDFPSPPAINASSTGFITLYNPSLSQILDLADYMWNGPLDVNAFKKIFANPMDCILGFSILPVSIPNTGAREICIGNIVASGVEANVASSQYVWFDCGSVEIKEFYGSYLDYAPYTKIELYLPFVGNVSLTPDEVMNKTINIRYLIDILSGAFVAFVKCGDTILYNFSGSCSTMIPVTGNDWSDLYRAIGEMALAVGTAGAAGAGLVAGAVGGAGAEIAAADVVGEAFSVGKDVVVGSVGAVMGSKPSIQKSGSLGGSVGQIGIRQPYLTITIPRQCLPQNQNKINGYPSQVYSKLGDLSGFTIVQNMNLEGISGTDAERTEITALLASGVIL